jgi:hypothetical protein
MVKQAHEILLRLRETDSGCVTVDSAHVVVREHARHLRRMFTMALRAGAPNPPANG